VRARRGGGDRRNRRDSRTFPLGGATLAGRQLIKRNVRSGRRRRNIGRRRCSQWLSRRLGRDNKRGGLVHTLASTAASGLRGLGSGTGLSSFNSITFWGRLARRGTAGRTATNGTDTSIDGEVHGRGIALVLVESVEKVLAHSGREGSKRRLVARKRG
jgi:hypothetical protein